MNCHGLPETTLKPWSSPGRPYTHIIGLRYNFGYGFRIFLSLYVIPYQLPNTIFIVNDRVAQNCHSNTSTSHVWRTFVSMQCH